MPIFKYLDSISVVLLLSTVTGNPILKLDTCCKSSMLTFICTVADKEILQWQLNKSNMDIISDHDRIVYLHTDRVGLEMQYTVLDDLHIELNLTSMSPLTSTLTANTSSLYGTTVSCRDEIGSSDPAHRASIDVHEPASPYNFFITLTHQESDHESPNFTTLEADLHWNSTADNIYYNVTIITELEESISNKSFHTKSMPWTQHTLYYNWDYNISVAATNCVGMSAPAVIHISWDDRCLNLPVVWANISFELNYSIGSQVYNCSPRQPQAEGFFISKCTNSDNWNPNMICTYNDDTTTSKSNEQDTGSHGNNIIVISIAVTMVVFIVVLTLTIASLTIVWIHKMKQGTRPETQTVELPQNEYTEVEHLQYYQEMENHAHTNNNGPDESLNLDSLLIQLRVEVTPKWHQFGVVVGIPENLLDQYSSYPADERLIEVLNYWLNNHQNTTWRDVAELLRDIELYELAEGIMNVYETGCLPVEIDADDSDSDDNILLPLPVPSNMFTH